MASPEALGTNKTLHTLDLYGNKITDDGAQALAKAPRVSAKEKEGLPRHTQHTPFPTLLPYPPPPPLPSRAGGGHTLFLFNVNAPGFSLQLL